ncbi:MAG: hypothetical protein NTY64_10685 [Deltaproteobacteria bacterium]|nr:hypothetical protein [Deltaproteobacteria bacterium]
MFRLHGWIGLGIIMVSGVLLFQGTSFVQTFFTPLAWSGYILFVDSVLVRIKKTSVIFDRPGEFLLLLPLSIGFWLIFEFYNLHIRNWHYVGLPEEMWLRWFGYAWAFATIWPAIFLTAALIRNWGWVARQKISPRSITSRDLQVSFLLGLGCLLLPIIAPAPLAKYLAAPVWLGFIFLLDPMNYWLGRNSLFHDLSRGDPRAFYSLLLSGLICGFLWEFWNYWAGGKWHYTLPILGDTKIFEMPVLGYLGFPAFAVECYAMYALAWNIGCPRKESAWLSF